MTRAELLGLIHNGESSSVEFKLDRVENYDLAREVAAFLNFSGGMILLGVADDGSIAGMTRPNLEEWVADLCRTKIEPPVIPYMEFVRDAAPGLDVAVVQFPIGPNKPYARVHNNRRTYYVRVGSTSREASRDELQRMFQESGQLNYGAKPVPGATFGDLDVRRLIGYFAHVLNIEPPTEEQEWIAQLCSLELMTGIGSSAVPTTDGLLLFGAQPERFLPQSGIRAIAYPGATPDYAAIADERLVGALTPWIKQASSTRERHVVVEAGLVEQALGFLRRIAPPAVAVEDGRRQETPFLPDAAVREIVINALVHRDYSIYGADIMLSLYNDRLEVVSPGKLPNTATVESLKAGFRYTRNQTIANTMRDCGYVELRGMGIRLKTIPAMRAFNGTEPSIVATEHSVSVLLFR